MNISFSSSLVQDSWDPDKYSGFRLGFKNRKRQYSLRAYRDDSEMDLHKRFFSSTTPTGGRYGILQLPFGIKVNVSRDNRTSHLTGFPYNVDVDDLIAALEETFNHLAVSALKYQSEYSYTDESEMRDEYQAVIDELSGKHLEDQFKDIGTEEEIAHQKELLESDDILAAIGCHCDLCRGYYEKSRQREKRNEKKKVKARERFLKVLPYLWD